MEQKELFHTTTKVDAPKYAFRLIGPADLTPDFMKSVMRFSAAYIERSKDTSLMPLQLVQAAERAALDPEITFQFWMLLNGETLAGYAVTELVVLEKGRELNINQAYIDVPHRTENLQRMTIEAMENFAREKKCVYLTSLTKRGSEEAYIKWMAKSGFRKRYVVVEKPLLEVV